MQGFLHGAFKATAEYVLPVRSSSAFQEKGVLTPEEFVAAGDFLVRTCPTWNWNAGDSKKTKPYLPADKQCLITRNVPCTRRAATVESGVVEQLLEGDDAEGGWLATHGVSDRAGEAGGGGGDDDDVPDMGGCGPGGGAAMADDEAVDMADFEVAGNVMDVDDAALGGGAYMSAVEPDDDNILRTRTYDVSITYDKYYQTPRVWLFGYDETRHPLTAEQMLADVSEDHAKKTITVEPHPHMALSAASIHPCRHANVMKKLNEMMSSGGSTPRVDQYLFIFLKFIASVLPTIEYDYTVSANMS